jgi:hypothetical protein
MSVVHSRLSALVPSHARSQVFDPANVDPVKARQMRVKLRKQVSKTAGALG